MRGDQAILTTSGSADARRPSHPRDLRITRYDATEPFPPPQDHPMRGDRVILTTSGSPDTRRPSHPRDLRITRCDATESSSPPQDHQMRGDRAISATSGPADARQPGLIVVQRSVDRYSQPAGECYRNQRRD